VSNNTVDDAGQVILVRCENIRVGGLNLSRTDTGIILRETNNSSISGNNITANNGGGIGLASSSNISISGNNITANNWYGILLFSSSNISISGNNIANNENGIWLQFSSNNKIYHNNFVNNTPQVYSDRSINIWDNGFPSGGNYWSDCKSTDLYRGTYQNETGNDGLGDTPYVIDANNQDRYPLMKNWIPLALVGDVNGDGKVGLADLVFLAQAYSSRPGDPNWNPNADIDGNGVVGLYDLVILAQNYGRTYP
jgi:parallel beta-helix repeat protein